MISRNEGLWLEDEGGEEGADVEFAELNREWTSRREEFWTAGYREGIEAGRHETVQEGFDQGFALGCSVGYEWGVIRGALLSLQATTAVNMITDTSALNAAQDRLESLRPENVQKSECISLLSLDASSDDGPVEGSITGGQSCRQGIKDDVVKVKEELQKSLEDSGYRIDVKHPSRDDS